MPLPLSEMLKDGGFFTCYCSPHWTTPFALEEMAADVSVFNNQKMHGKRLGHSRGHGGMLKVHMVSRAFVWPMFSTLLLTGLAESVPFSLRAGAPRGPVLNDVTAEIMLAPSVS